MTIWVDADACRMSLKEIFTPRRRAEYGAALFWLPIRALRVPPSRFIRTLRVAAGVLTLADNEIVRQCEAGDLVITRIFRALAAEIAGKGAAALNPRENAMATPRFANV